MQIAYLITTLIIGMFLSYIWSSASWANTALKMVFSVWTVWTMFMLLGTLEPYIANGTMRLY